MQIKNTLIKDFEQVISFFKQVLQMNGQDGYKVWENIDENGLRKDIENKLHFKIVEGQKIIGVFSLQKNDHLIWGDKDKNDAIYIHRIARDPNYKGKKLFQEILEWTKEYAIKNNLNIVRMDTWADNNRIIEYYKSYGFKFIDFYKTSSDVRLPIQNRNINVALLELLIKK